MPEGPLALVGSGEFLPQMRDVDARLLAGRPARAAILPTASAPEGEDVFDRWMTMGVEHYRSLGVEPVPVPVTDRESADDPALAALIAGCGLVYLSGGNPGYLAASLRGSLVLAAVLDAWRGGAALAGCSAGAMALGSRAPDVRTGVPQEGLGVLAHIAVIPHFDRMTAWRPALVDETRSALGPGEHLVGIDEDTALVGGPDVWEVAGRQSVWLLTAEGRTEHRPGTTLELLP